MESVLSMVLLLMSPQIFCLRHVLCGKDFLMSKWEETVFVLSLLPLDQEHLLNIKNHGIVESDMSSNSQNSAEKEV